MALAKLLADWLEQNPEADAMPLPREKVQALVIALQREAATKSLVDAQQAAGEFGRWATKAVHELLPSLDAVVGACAEHRERLKEASERHAETLRQAQTWLALAWPTAERLREWLERAAAAADKAAKPVE